MSFCDQMTAAIDSARTLTRLDHLSRSIWQGLAAGAVADDDAQALAERLHARRSVLRGEIKPVGIPAGRPSIFPPRRLQSAPKRPVAIARRPIAFGYKTHAPVPRGDCPEAVGVGL